MARRLHLAFAVALCALLLSPAGSPAGGKPRAAACADVTLLPAAGSLPAVRTALLCLHNRDRAARGLPPLRENARLRAAAVAHARDMVRDRYFAHERPGGADMATRILDSGYANRRVWSLGENIAWGSGARASAEEIHRAWMASPGHRANILRRQFREVGFGIALGVPVDGPGDGATFAADFGSRR
jgi:uncharacterized protein YkwD